MFWCYWLLLLPARIARRRRELGGVRVAIESGRIGWTHVFYEELHQSAVEYLGGVQVQRLEIDRDAPYLPQFRTFMRDGTMTHLVLDPRTGSQSWGRVLVDLLVMSWILTRRRIVPLVILTDASFRRHRLQAAVLTATNGAVVTFVSDHVIAPLFPHRRIIGPLPMPVSVRRLEALEKVCAEEARSSVTTVRFIGSVYPPRASFLRELGERLSQLGLTLEIHADKYETSNDDYWRILATSNLLVTTTLQGMPRAYMDWIWNQQLVFRFSEALCAGAVLVAPVVTDGDRYFAPSEDFVPFVSVDDAAAALADLAADEARREAVRAHGHATAERLARSHAFWSAVDSRLPAGSRVRD